jgi:hypothetical protein
MIFHLLPQMTNSNQCHSFQPKWPREVKLKTIGNNHLEFNDKNDDGHDNDTAGISHCGKELLTHLSKNTMWSAHSIMTIAIIFLENKTILAGPHQNKKNED